jgi:hypothetical protein
VERCRQGNTYDSSRKTRWQCYEQSHLVANQKVLGEVNDEFSPRSIYYLFILRSGFLHAVKSYDMGVDGFTYRPNGVLQRIFIAFN